MRYLLNVLIFCTLFFGCAASSYEMHQRLDPLIGNDINQLISKWGPPTDVYEFPNGEKKIYTWYWSGGKQVVGSYYKNLDMTVYSEYENFCKIAWTVDKFGKMESFKYAGQCVFK